MTSPLAPVLAVAAMTSCSTLLIQRLPEGYDGETQPRCDTGSGPVVFDFAIAIVNTAAGVAVAVDGVSKGAGGELGVGLGVLAFALLYGWSGVAGGHATAECERAIGRWDRAHRATEDE